MTQSFQCPHCRTLLPSSAPGVIACPSCRRAARIPDAALLEKQRADRKHAAMLVGLVVGLVYGLPMLMVAGYCAFMMVVYVIMIVAALAGAAAQ